jgi:hypothetical protein
MTELTAIDVLIDPDAAAIDRARVINARLLTSVPGGWQLDDSHVPHITTLQRYVRTADLDRVYAAVEKVVAATEMGTLSFTAVKITHTDWGFPGYAPTVILAQVNDAVLVFQSDLEAAIRPFVEPGGTSAAFVTTADEPDISPTIIDWVENYVPAQIGAGNYLPHLTVGVATFDDLKVIEAEPFDPFTVHPVRVSIFHLGNNGTARQFLADWRVA